MYSIKSLCTSSYNLNVHIASAEKPISGCIKVLQYFLLTYCRGFQTLQFYDIEKSYLHLWFRPNNLNKKIIRINTSLVIGGWFWLMFSPMSFASLQNSFWALFFAMPLQACADKEGVTCNSATNYDPFFSCFWTPGGHDPQFENPGLLYCLIWPGSD